MKFADYAEANKKSSSPYDFDKNTVEGYLKLSDLYDKKKPAQKFVFLSVHFSEGKFGTHALVGIYKDNIPYFVDMPKHLTKYFDEITDDDDVIADINAGKAAFIVYPYKGGNDKTYYSIEFVSAE